MVKTEHLENDLYKIKKIPRNTIQTHFFLCFDFKIYIENN